MPMGNGLSPIAVELVMDFVLTEVKKRIKTIFDIDILTLKKYVDDLFCIIPDGMQNTFLEIFNGVNRNIQFTVESEKDCSLPFLDTLVLRCPTTGTITTKWYRKPVSSGRLLNYKSFHPLSQKIGMAKGFIHRVANSMKMNTST